MKKEYITAEELKKILEFAIKIDVELGVYISFTGLYIEIDQYRNKHREKVKTYYFERDEMPNIFTHITAYRRFVNTNHI